VINVYVAGASKNKERARAFMDRVRADPNMKITKDWVADIDDADAAGKADADFSDEERKAFADADINGITGADVVVLLLDETASSGRWVELGYALCLRVEGTMSGVPRVIVSGGGKRSIFTAPGLVDHEVQYAPGDHDGPAFAILKGYADEAA